MTSLQSDPNRLLQLLAQAGAIRIEGNRAIAQRRELVMDYAHPAAVNRAIQLSADFASTLHHNLSRDARDPGRFERAVVTTRLSCRHVPSLLAYLRIHGQSFLEDLDEWMAARESVEAGTPIGVGVYLFVGRRPPNG